MSQINHTLLNVATDSESDPTLELLTTFGLAKPHLTAHYVHF